MHARGFDDRTLLENTELHGSDLDDPYRLISEEQARKFYRNAVDLAAEPGIGLEIGYMTNVADKGPLGLLQIAARTVEDAVEDAWSTRDTYNALVDWAYKRRGDTVVVQISCSEEYEPLRIFLLERALGIFQANTEELADSSSAYPTKVLLDYKTPENYRRYKEIFRCPISFDQDVVEIQYPIKYLTREVVSHDKLSYDILQELQKSLLNKMSVQTDIVHDVKMALRRNPGKFPGIEEVANNLFMSSRTLRRKLGAHDVRFQDLLDEERRRVAADLLIHSDLTIQQIAEECGFSDAQNFSQAFKRWSGGASPSEYRDTHLEEDDPPAKT